MPRLQVVQTLEPKEPVWHRAAGEYQEKQYRQLVGICGYTVAPSIALFLGYKLTRAVKPTKGILCGKCEQVAADEEAFARRNPPKPNKEGTTT